MSRLSSLLKPRLFSSKSVSSRDDPNDWRYRISKLAFNLSQFPRYGLYSDDVYNLYTPLVDEALRRLPKDVMDARNFRTMRAAQLDFLKMHLPKEKWITYEQDLEYRYLQPYIQEIIAERREIYDFGCSNYVEND
ncbi:cytochrome b-c1 complex subunit 7-like [Osmia bicornis bicornis]|uniref:cytochrome b-c1 complex subunit 7-like n=1 Tax=Osmia bicornis bicornis TaxID=1437191 RepID=UPI0010F4812E|nr:cytochrome b-c1 complex subunit 7-like [Osmia bicornis bicornis]